MNWISSLKAYRSIKTHRRKGKELDNWKPEKREDKSAMRRGNRSVRPAQSTHPTGDLALCLCQGFRITATKTHSPGLLSTEVSPTCQSHSMDVYWLQGPALQTRTTELEVSAPWGTGCRVFQHTQLVMWTSWYFFCVTQNTGERNSALAHSSFGDMKDSSCACCSRLSITQSDGGLCYLWFKSPTSC